VPKFSRYLFAAGSAPSVVKSKKGNLFNETQCQSQNTPVPNSSAYDMDFAKPVLALTLVSSHKVSYAKKACVQEAETSTN
jgi:hypothetical protein